MRLEKQFTVGAPLDQVWRALSDAAVFAASIPGSQLGLVDGIYAGPVDVAGNGSQTRYEATVHSLDADEDEHAATILLHARQLGGAAIGSATLRCRCEPADGTTRVSLTVELISSGHAAGEEVGERARLLFEEASAALEERAAAPVAEPPAREAPPATALTQPSESAELLETDGRLPRQVSLLVSVLIALALVSWLLGRRRSGRW